MLISLDAREFFYVYPDPSNNGVQRRVLKADQSVPHNKGETYPICGPNDVALTQRQDDFTSGAPLLQIVLCPAFFDAQNMRQSLSVRPPPSEAYLGEYKYAAGALYVQSPPLLCSAHLLMPLGSMKFYTHSGTDVSLYVEILVVGMFRSLTMILLQSTTRSFHGRAKRTGRAPTAPTQSFLANDPGEFVAQYGSFDVVTLPEAYNLFTVMCELSLAFLGAVP